MLQYIKHIFYIPIYTHVEHWIILGHHIINIVEDDAIDHRDHPDNQDWDQQSVLCHQSSIPAERRVQGGKVAK